MPARACSGILRIIFISALTKNLFICIIENGFQILLEGEISVAEKGTYRTRAQEAVLNYLKATIGTHHTVSEIKAHFSGQDQPIGTATIYRQLERFVEDGSIQKYTLGPGGSACYAYVGDRQCNVHYHCKCEVCGRLIHLNCDELAEIRSHLLEHYGFSWNAGKTVFYGVCEDCRKE